MGKLTDAVENKSLRTVKKLLKKEYANNPLLNDEQDKDGYCALYSAVKSLVMYSSMRGFRKECSTMSDIIKCLLKAGAKVDQSDKDGRTPLNVAATDGCMEAIEILLKAGAKVDQPNNSGCTPLFWAISNGCHINAMLALLNAGANVNHVANSGGTPLWNAAYHGHAGAVQILLKAKANIDQATNKGDTPLFIAAELGKTEVVDILLKADAKVDQPMNNGWTPLYVAAWRGNANIVELLLPFAQVNVRLQSNASDVYDKAREGNKACIELLQKIGGSVDRPPQIGATPLWVAVENGHTSIVKMLLEKGANPHIRTNNGKSPLDVAKELNRGAIIGLLEVYQQKTPAPVNMPVVPLPQAAPNPYPASPAVAVAQEPGVLKVSFSINPDELTVDKKLGAGGFGAVYQGTWRKHIVVAIKQLHLMQLSKEVLDDFQHEMEIMAQLRAPYIVQFYGATVAAPYRIVMEYMANGSLYHVLHSNIPLPWSAREPIALDISKGLSYLHHQNILHRDLKSLNVLLDEHMKAKLCDFGLAKVKTESSSQSNNGAAGTLLWMAPELFQRRAVCTKETDVYSLGMTLWELASREIPFKDASNQAIARSWIEKGDREDIPKDTPPQIAKAITFCWSQEASNRPTCDQVVESLGNVDNNVPQSQPKYFSNTYS